MVHVHGLAMSIIIKPLMRLPSKKSFLLPLLWILLLFLAIKLIKMEDSPNPSAVLKWFQDKRFETKQAAGIKYLNMILPPTDAYKELLRENDSGTGQPSAQLTTYYEQIVTVMPDNSQAYNVLGFCYFRQGLYEQAYDQFQKSCLLDPHSFWGCQNWATMELGLHQYDAAEKLFTMVLNSDPRHTLENISSSKVYSDILASGPSYNPGTSLQQGYADAAKILYLLQKNLFPDPSDLHIRIF